MSLFDNNLNGIPTPSTPWLEFYSADMSEKIILNLSYPLQDDENFMKSKIYMTYESQSSADEPVIKVNHTLEHTHLKTWPETDQSFVQPH